MIGGVGAVVVLLLTGTLTGYAAKHHAVDWTVDGVEQYQMNPLEVVFGDTITFTCDPNIISNFVYVETQEQYDSCNSSVNSGQALQIADCLVPHSGPGSFDQKIQQLSGGDQEAVVEYQAGKSHYFYSSFNNVLAPSDPPYIGGQCLTGLKMVISVVSQLPISTAVLATAQPTISPSSHPGGAQNPGGDPAQVVSYTIIAGVTGGGVLLILLLVVVLLVVLVVNVRNKNPHRRGNLEIGSSNQVAASNNDVKGSKSCEGPIADKGASLFTSTEGEKEDEIDSVGGGRNGKRKAKPGQERNNLPVIAGDRRSGGNTQGTNGPKPHGPSCSKSQQRNPQPQGRLAGHGSSTRGPSPVPSGKKPDSTTVRVQSQNNTTRSGNSAKQSSHTGASSQQQGHSPQKKHNRPAPPPPNSANPPPSI